jgi:hypothetical protein
VAAALGAGGKDLWIVEETDWIGGQVTSQGVSALDEHREIESWGGPETYRRFREEVRRRRGRANPGGGWVSRLCFEPRVGLEVLEEMLEGTRILRETTLVSAETEGDRIAAVTARREDGSRVRFLPRFVLDATDTGEVLALAGVEHRTGAESRAQTGEPHATEIADPRRTQAFTYTFAVEFRPGEDHTIPKPPGYERFRETQPYSLVLPRPDGTRLRYGFFRREEGTPGSFWDYRRVGPDLSIINWPGNDYRGTPILEADHEEAKSLSLGFLYWLQTECPRDDGGQGYHELRLRPDVMGTAHGLSKRPYVREGRRLEARTMLREQDLTEGRAFPDSIGVGWYPIDLHACFGDDVPQGDRSLPTKPFQIPLGALVPVRVRNLLAAGKCLGVTHVANGATRVHPVEWSVGEAAGRVAAFCLERGIEPAAILEDEALVRALQERLRAAGIPREWGLAPRA